MEGDQAVSLAGRQDGRDVFKGMVIQVLGRKQK